VAVRRPFVHRERALQRTRVLVIPRRARYYERAPREVRFPKRHFGFLSFLFFSFFFFFSFLGTAALLL
jgi:hypothetical protein